MSNEQVSHTRTAPTEKMIAAAKVAATRHGVELPSQLESDFDTCKAFLDKYLSKPSDKALSYANSIARDKGLTIPDAALANAKELSAWIDENK